MMTLTLILLIAWMKISTLTNPVKMGLMMVLICMVMLMKMYLTSGMSWFSYMFMMIFVGGILMMFMILSSLSPNETLSKFKSKLSWALMSLLVFFMSAPMMESVSMPSSMIKSIFSNSIIILTLTIPMIMYFFVFIWVISKEQNSLRSNFFWKNKFCKF